MFVVKEDELTYPVSIGLFGPETQVFSMNDISQLLKKFFIGHNIWKPYLYDVFQLFLGVGDANIIPISYTKSI